ncbi:DUF393 domain-containing protein [Altererythrobacter soli]|uniref:DUF393 domain-containing protein n=2 Tax=Croceibacterium soli TaxID=1739690 RepID=A0A6I4UWK5_9SPHN|nr:DUF393 domain-containing protein [Croceibacterium soli]
METEHAPADPAADNWLLYDGECPFCSAYVRMVRLRKNLGALRMVDAREHGAEYREATELGYDLNDGMLLKLSGRFYHGDESIHVLALASSSQDWFGRFNGWIFRSRKRSAALYPLLRSGRSMALRLLGREKLKQW